jgi:hypothetical protein
VSGEGNAPMVIAGSAHSSQVDVEFGTVWWRALVIAVMISLSTEEFLLFDERIQILTVTVCLTFMGPCTVNVFF